MKGNKKKVIAFQNGKGKNKPEKRFSSDSLLDATQPKRRRKFNDENVESSDEEGGYVDSEAGDEEENKEDEIVETVGEVRLRKAVEMVEKFRASEKKHEEEDTDSDEDEESRMEKDGNRDSRIAKVLQQEQMEDSGRLRRIIASRVQKPEVSEGFRFLIKHRQPVTAVALSDDDSRGFSASKDGTIMHWDVENGKTEKYAWPSAEILKSHGVKDPQGRVKKHNRQVLALAVSSDGRYLASGGLDRHIHLWDTSTREHIQAFPGHKGPVSCLMFRHGTSELFSGSFDRSVKIWNAEDRTYVSTLFGHQSDVLTIDSLRKERVLTVGRDRTMHLWKVPEESQLVFRAPASSLECCCFISNDEFLSGSDDGSIQHWSVLRKKPIHILKNAHASSNEHVLLPESNGLSNGHLDGDAQHSLKHGPNAFSWVNSVAVCRNSDLAASGAGNGLIRLWEIENDKGIKPLFELPLDGFVNSLAFAKSGKFLIAGVGKEHRLGRWGSIPAARDGVAIYRLKLS